MRRMDLALFAVVVTLGTALPYASADLDADIEFLVKQSGLLKATVGVSVIDADAISYRDGDLVRADVHAERPLVPASNLKLLTSGAALHVLGSDFAFKTRVVQTGSRLVIVGDGDPAFGDPTLLEKMSIDDRPGLSVDEFLRLWVDPIVARGVPEFDEIVVDDRVFDRSFVHPGWPKDQLNRRYCAEVAGLNFHLNVLYFYPARSGSVVNVDYCEPRAGWITVNGRRGTAKTGPKDGNTAWLSRSLEANDFTFYGNVKHSYRTPVPATLHDPPIFFGMLVRERLQSNGVKVGEVRRPGADEELYDEGLLDEGRAGETIGPVISTPISVALERCNSDSYNLYAESLLKRTVHGATASSGTWIDGAAIVRHVLHQRIEGEHLASELVIDDGSGLSRHNRVAPVVFTYWLRSFHRDEKLGPPLRESLAIGGVSGTLDKRPALAEDRIGAIVRAKSGYINNVSCLSGYVEVDGRTMCFSIMVNGFRGSSHPAKRLQERIVKAIADSMRDRVELGG